MNIVWIILAAFVLINTAVIIAIAKMRADTFPKSVRERLLDNMDKLEKGLKELSQHSIHADASGNRYIFSRHLRVRRCLSARNITTV